MLVEEGRVNSLRQQFPTRVQWLQEFLKPAIPDYLVRGADLFSLRLSNKKMTTANTTVVAVWCECLVLNHKYIGHIVELHLIGHVT